MGIPNVVTANIRIGTVTVSEKSFGVGLIVGETGLPGGVRVKTYTSIDSVELDFATTDPEYKAAEAYFAQQPAPLKLKIGVKEAADADYKEALSAIFDIDPEFYAVSLTTRVVADAKAASEWVETRGRLFYAASNDTELVDSTSANDTTSIWFETKDNTRTIILFSADTGYADAAMMSRQITYDPGSYTMKFKDLATITVDTLTDTQKQNAWGKKVNTYSQVAGAKIIENGSTNTEWIDIINGADWIKAKIEERVFVQFLKNPKIPFTDGGIGILSGVVDGVLKEAQEDMNIISPDDYDDDDKKVGGFTVTTKPARDVPETEKNNREYKYIDFTAYLAGAIHSAIINGTLTY